DGKPLTGNENAFAFKASWASPTDFYYVSDGKIRRRTLGVAEPKTIEFTADFTVTKPSYVRRARDFSSRTPRRALGIVRPVISPDGKRVAFAALGDIYMMSVGGKPANLTRDAAFDTDPAWSPDGTKLAYASDKGGHLNDIWIRDVASGTARQL